MIYLEFLIALTSTSIRVTVLLVSCPPFSNRTFSGRIKAMLGTGLGSACTQRIGPAAQTDLFMVECAIQVFIGFSMVLMARTIPAAIQTAGFLLDLEGGFTMAQAFDSLTMTDQTTFGRVYELTAMALLFTTSGCQPLIMDLARFLIAMSPRVMLDMSNYAERLVYRFAELTISTLEIAGPPLLVLSLTDMDMGLLTKVVLAINAFALGFPSKITATTFFAPAVIVVLLQPVVKLVDVAVKLWAGVILQAIPEKRLERPPHTTLRRFARMVTYKNPKT